MGPSISVAWDAKLSMLEWKKVPLFLKWMEGDVYKDSENKGPSIFEFWMCGRQCVECDENESPPEYVFRQSIEYHMYTHVQPDSRNIQSLDINFQCLPIYKMVCNVQIVTESTKLIHRLWILPLLDWHQELVLDGHDVKNI